MAPALENIYRAAAAAVYYGMPSHRPPQLTDVEWEALRGELVAVQIELLMAARVQAQE